MVDFDEEYLVRSVEIEPLALEEEFIRLPSDLARWNHLYSDAVAAYLSAKFAREQVYASLHGEMRQQLMDQAVDAATAADAEGKKKARVKAPTVGDIEAAVLLHPDYKAAKEAEIEAERNKAHLYGVVDSVRTKRDMLIQIGAQRRAEMQMDPMIKEETRAQRAAAGL